jgi:hypothetical protein
MEVYRNRAGEILKVEKLQNGRLMAKAEKESKSFENYKQLAVYLYNKGYHLVMTDRATLFARLYEDAKDLSTLIGMIPNGELAFMKDGAIYTCWFLADNADGTVEVSCNAPFAAVNWQGYKAVTLNISDLIVIQGDI